jgi:hypothetical protein
MFGVERSTVSKVLRQKEKYLATPEERCLSPIKRQKGKFADIDRALSSWVRNSHKQGIPLTDAAIKEKAILFANTVGSPESFQKAHSQSWLEKFKQKNAIGPGGKLVRRVSDQSIDDGLRINTALGPEPYLAAPLSPNELVSPLSLASSAAPDSLDSYLDFASAAPGVYRHSTSHSTTSLSSVFSDPPDCASPTSLAFSPDASAAYLGPAHSRHPSSVSSWSRPRSQAAVAAAAAAAAAAEPLTPRRTTVEAEPELHHSASTNSVSSVAASADDARAALQTLLSYFAAPAAADGDAYMAVVRLTEKLGLGQPQPPQQHVQLSHVRQQSQPVMRQQSQPGMQQSQPGMQQSQPGMQQSASQPGQQAQSSPGMMQQSQPGQRPQSGQDAEVRIS